MPPTINTNLARAVEARRKELGLTVSDLIAATGLTGPALLNIRKGLVRNYQERLTGPVCRVLQWTPDSIDRLLAGKPAKPLQGDEPTTAAPSRMAKLEATVNQLAAKLESLAARVDTVERRGAAPTVRSR